jgi:DNA-binding NtrC family response regulator
LSVPPIPAYWPMQQSRGCGVVTNQQTQTVLVVDDEPLVLLNASEIIQQAGWQSLKAENSAQALRVLEEQGPVDVLFTDINMPGEMNGLELAAQVHRLYPRIHLIITSGKQHLSDSELPDHGTFLPKPYGVEQLTRTIERKLAVHS